ncbi:hypothetical protein HOY34_20125 [Xinfangfangia sp. D13-10-4-6]|uniref:ImmA/IrrE family metallo-endopeptidase n=1 Tax=Pseudogemmobacter hezensis TaxID=2737662 RepID=UPI00155477E0|nr:hypothetical protein [Pseudogemmobacter hezensis]NPD17497.1 hypothetical protein [Pseudogemmobacter hezensis]
MTELHITHDWNSYDDSLTECGETTARLGIFLDGYCLTKNHDLFSKTIRDQIHVSLYPLAMWLASSWWRLHYEVLPDTVRKSPPHDWRMSHEMAAANMGFLWPQIVFSPDADSIQVWAQASQGQREDAVRFLNGLDYASIIPKDQFTREMTSLISSVVARLHEVGCKDSDLAIIWGFISEDLNNPVEHKKRRLEAVLGFDPESCPEYLIAQAIDLEARIGADSFSELSGAYAQDTDDRIGAIQCLIQAEGLKGAPSEVLDFNFESATKQPWESAVSAARKLRQTIGDVSGPVKDSVLSDLLGLSLTKFKEWIPVNAAKAAVAGPEGKGAMKFVPRRRHPIAQRFDLARFIGDYIRTPKNGQAPWLVSADLSSARQKFQRAFAAEFLCPINSLVEFLSGDFSEAALSDASDHFSVSERTVDSLLMNNGYLPRYAANYGMPYRVAL